MVFTTVCNGTPCVHDGESGVFNDFTYVCRGLPVSAVVFLVAATVVQVFEILGFAVVLFGAGSCITGVHDGFAGTVSSGLTGV